MTDKLFYQLWYDALEQPDQEMYIAEYGYPEWFDEISSDVNTVIATLSNIHVVAHATIRDILQAAGLTQSAFCCKFCVPRRTVEDWCTNKRVPPDYIRLLFARQLGLLNKTTKNPETE